MPTTRIIAGRTQSERVVIEAKGSGSKVLSVAPRSFSSDGGASIASIERQGREALTRVDGPKKPTVSFTIELGRTDWTESVQDEVDWLEEQRDHGRRISFSGLPAQLSGWWHIESMPVEVTQMTPNHQISRASLSFSLIAALDFTGKVQRTPPPPPKKPKAPKAKKPVHRTHTVVSGDWLSKIAGRYLGNVTRWPEIYELNKSEIKNPDLIYPGQVFKIPPK